MIGDQTDKPVVVALGAAGFDDIPGLAGLADAAAFRFVSESGKLSDALAGADVLLGWDFQADALAASWPAADRLRWIHWGGAGVDALLFPELLASPVILTNSRGIFDGAMAEYVLGLVIALAKEFPENTRLQAQRSWRHRLTERVAGKQALVVGAGNIGRAIARSLQAVGMEVRGVGRTQRDADPVFGTVHGRADLETLLPDADYVVLITPLTNETRGMFSSTQFGCMKPTARFINVGRGLLVDEAAMIDCLRDGVIASAALDVFETEPLPASSPLWDLPNVIVSPHMSGDFLDFHQIMADVFIDNFRRFQRGEPLTNVVDMGRGY